MHREARRLVERLHLEPHPEGGWYRQTFRSTAHVTSGAGLVRSAMTSILFLLCSGNFSAFHRILSDETWHFYRGDPIVIETIEPAGFPRSHTLGQDDAFQTTVPAGTYFAAHVDVPDGYALVGCNVAPGFEFADFSLPSRALLIAGYPHLRALIERYTR
jgi:predicted cupin superfamily sugar epimerase